MNGWSAAARISLCASRVYVSVCSCVLFVQLRAQCFLFVRVRGRERGDRRLCTKYIRRSFSWRCKSGWHRLHCLSIDPLIAQQPSM